MPTELTNLHCQKAVAKDKPQKLFDHGGLHLLVTPAGGKLWRWAYRYQGKVKQMAFGKYPEVPLAEARVRHAAARRLLASGVDPMAERKEQREAERAERAEPASPSLGFTFADLTWKWFAWWKRGKNQRYVTLVESRLNEDVISKIGPRRPEEISRPELVQLTQATDQRGARDIARRNLQIIRQIFDWGMDNSLLDDNFINPAAGIKPDRILSKAVEKPFAHVEPSELPTLLRKMQDYDGEANTRLMMELLALTFVRTESLLKAEWAEIDWQKKVWTIPKEHMKNKTYPHLVPLARQTMVVLKRLRDKNGHSSLILPSSVSESGMMSNNTILAALETMGYKGKMTGHGWRKIASTYLHDEGFEHLHIETQLAHVDGAGNSVAGVYNYAEYMKFRPAMMQHWADYLDQSRESTNTKKEDHNALSLSLA